MVKCPVDIGRRIRSHLIFYKKNGLIIKKINSDFIQKVNIKTDTIGYHIFSPTKREKRNNLAKILVPYEGSLATLNNIILLLYYSRNILFMSLSALKIKY